ncbi:hypothetical protein JG687_00000589 [Phytophthora cactorum]|uniref:Uncharacterized protein n=1 Tax=Phytophthora cactorum TaxID=29920 RepID=A0A8T1V0L2_9STRA|nr:hypothetical protein JG687_00000589 [Phytophthora cactorum]
MRSSSSPRGSGSLRRFFSRRHRRGPHGASGRATSVSGAAAQRSLAARTRLLDSWSLPELYALRELVHVAVNKTFIAPEVQLDAPALQRAGHGDEPMRTGASSSASSSTTATSSIEDLKRQQQLQTHVDSALVRSKRFYFSRRADTRLRLNTRRQFVRLFPLLGRTSRTAQRALFRAFDANDTGKIEFDELCEMLARVKQVRGSSVREMAELAFAWFQGDKSEAVLTHPDVKLLAVTVMELEGDSKAQTEHGYDLVASLMKLMLGREQHQVTKQNFCQEMDCELGAHVLHVLLAPFGRKCTFDPNLFFSLPIPESNFVRVEVSVLLQARKLPDGDDDENDRETALQTVQQGFWLRRGSNVGELCDRIAEVHGRAAGNRFLLVEVRRNRIKRIVEGDEAVDKLATAAPGSLSAYERAWTLAEIPAVPATIRDYFNDGNVAGDAKTIIAEKIRSFSDLRVGSRVDARDNHNDWHPGTVIEVAGGSETEQDDTNRKQHQRVCVHFDAFSSKWNKWFTARDWKAKRLQPLATRTSKSTEVFEVQVVHRFASQPSSVAASESGQTSGDDHSFAGILPSSQKVSISSSHERLSINVFGTPLFVTIASDKTAQDMHQALFLQTARFWREFNGDPESTGNTQHKDLKQTKLPYEVRVVNLEDLTSERGEPLPTDSSALLQHFSTRSVLALDWFDVHDYSSCEERAPEDVPDEVAEAAKADPDLRADLDAAASSKETTVPEEKAPLVDDDSPPMYAVPLAKCMDALMREEAISLEDHWVCERCGVPREGTRLSAIWRLPDLVMVQLKRFQYLENQHKQKVRALVDFPLKGLDFSKWMGHQDEGSSVYDLYAVANHVGGLTRGHYTAYCRYDADFPESSALFKTSEESGDVQCPELWFRFDDEKVSEIAAGDVVTDAAYVLFYKRRTLSPHNVLQYAL